MPPPECLCQELRDAKLHFARQVALPIIYKGRRLDVEYKIGWSTGGYWLRVPLQRDLCEAYRRADGSEVPNRFAEPEAARG